MDSDKVPDSFNRLNKNVQLRACTYDDDPLYNVNNALKKKWVGKVIPGGIFVQSVSGVKAERYAKIMPWSTQTLVIEHNIDVDITKATLGNVEVGQITRMIQRKGLALVDCGSIKNIIVTVQNPEEELKPLDWIEFTVTGTDMIAGDSTIIAAGEFIRKVDKNE